MDDEAAIAVVALLANPAVAALLILLDRRRLGPYGRGRMWNQATLAIALFPPMGVPGPFAVGAHVWVTRPGPGWKRLGKAIGAALLALVLLELLAEAMLAALSLPAPS